MFKKRVCRDIERDKTLGFGCYHSPNGTQQSYSGDLFPIDEMKCDVCQLTTKDILLHICHNKRRNPGENKICSTCTIAVSQSTQNEIHKNREINWTIQNHRTPIVTALICVKIIAEIGINHNGSIKLTKDLIDLSKVAGCDYVKFQKMHMCYFSRKFKCVI